MRCIEIGTQLRTVCSVEYCTILPKEMVSDNDNGQGRADPATRGTRDNIFLNTNITIGCQRREYSSISLLLR